jgi:hypothetical protein
MQPIVVSALGTSIDADRKNAPFQNQWRADNWAPLFSGLGLTHHQKVTPCSRQLPVLTVFMPDRTGYRRLGRSHGKSPRRDRVPSQLARLLMGHQGKARLRA